jgi:hypothetical protein
METVGNKSLAKTSYKFYCETCDYGTSKKCNFDVHCCSIKHKNNVSETNGNVLLAKTCNTKNVCNICEKNFTNRSGLWKHKKKCKNEESNDILDIFSDKNIILEILKSNKEFKDIIIEQGKNMLEMANKIGSNNCNNTNTNTNSNNNTHFNLQFFLNETCKDALNLTDFVEQFKLQLSDLDMVGRVGYTEGMSKLFIKNLNELDVHKRPIHCSDLKRETLYVKDKDTWEKENSENVKLKQAIKKVEHKNIKQIPQWKEENPTADDTETKKHMEYQNILLEVMGGSTMEDDNKKHEKIIKNIAKEVAIEKTKT